MPRDSPDSSSNHSIGYFGWVGTCRRRLLARARRAGLFLLVDGEIRFDLGELCDRSDVDVAGPDAMQARWANMSLEDFKKVAGATKVDAKLGALELLFTDTHRECLRKLLAEVTPLIVIRKPRRPPVPGLDDVEEQKDEGLPDSGPNSEE